MRIRNVARWARGDCIECGYLSTDDRPLSTECLMDAPSNYCFATCKKADTHKFFLIPSASIIIIKYVRKRNFENGYRDQP